MRGIQASRGRVSPAATAGESRVVGGPGVWGASGAGIS